MQISLAEQASRVQENKVNHTESVSQQLAYRQKQIDQQESSINLMQERLDQREREMGRVAKEMEQKGESLEARFQQVETAARELEIEKTRERESRKAS